jgi:hypothetical protein
MRKRGEWGGYEKHNDLSRVTYLVGRRGQLWTLLYHFKFWLLSCQAFPRTVWVRVWVWLCSFQHGQGRQVGQNISALWGSFHWGRGLVEQIFIDDLTYSIEDWRQCRTLMTSTHNEEQLQQAYCSLDTIEWRMSSLCLLNGIWSVLRTGQNRGLIHILRHWMNTGTQSLEFYPEDAKGDTILDRIGNPIQKGEPMSSPT